jgi:hypothetical protein
VKTRALPPHLFAAYEWTKSAGEIDNLREGGGRALSAYIKTSAANAIAHDVAGVTEETMWGLYRWLTYR